jgi:hypothetical protein
MNEYEELFVHYVAELRQAIARSDKWWQGLQQKERARATSEDEAMLTLERRWPFGPSTHPWVLGVYRKYYLLVEELNARASGDPGPPESPPTEEDWGDEGSSTTLHGATDKAETDDIATQLLLVGEDSPFYEAHTVRPRTFLVDALYGRADDLAESMTWIILTPIGRDQSGNVY